jgi:hypothetical protein
MATWPSASKASTANLDSGTDSPASARADLKNNVDNVNSIIDMFNITSPTDNQVLQYSTANSRFEVATPSSGGNNNILISAPSVVLPASPTNTTSVFSVRSSGGVSGVSATTGEFTLPAGTYVFTYPTMYSNSTADIQLQTRYYDGGIWYEFMMHPVTVLDYASNASNTMVPMAQGIFTIAASTRFSFRQDTATSRTLSSRASDGSGQGLVTTFLLFRFEKI